MKKIHRLNGALLSILALVFMCIFRHSNFFLSLHMMRVSHLILSPLLQAGLSASETLNRANGQQWAVWCQNQCLYIFATDHCNVVFSRYECCDVLRVMDLKDCCFVLYQNWQRKIWWLELCDCVVRQLWLKKWSARLCNQCFTDQCKSQCVT